MKKLLSCIIICLPLMLIAQSVAINNDASAPDNSALLDIKSTTKGLLIPRMTSIERAAIVSPAVGLLVFDTNSSSFWIYRGDLNNGWVEMVHSQQNYWSKNGIHIFNNTLGNVGIGTSTPASTLTINGADPSIGFLNNGLAIGNLQSIGFDMKMGTHPDNPIGDIVFQPKGIDRVWIDENGQVGIGTATPSSLLTVDGTNPLLQMRHSNSNKGFIQALGNDLKLGTNSTNTTGNLIFQTKQLDRMTIDETGRVGIGTTSPTYPLTVNGTDPIVQLQNDNVGKGFLQVLGEDMKIGTNTSNTLGKLIIRTNGADRMQVNPDGKVGINTTHIGSMALTIGDNSGAITGVDFKEGNNSNGYLIFNTTSSSIKGNNGTMTISSYGNGIKLYQDGKMSIGGSFAANNYLLSVHGKVIATDFRTLEINNWPDYVFEKDYNLKPLSEVKKFIEENKHLPNIPSASEIEKTGVSLGDISKRLMEKIEELTLYILQQQEQIDELKNQIQKITAK